LTWFGLIITTVKPAEQRLPDSMADPHSDPAAT
jgi:hypothetical protein